jgi:iron complex transport system substrate-binding protein
VRVVSLVPAGTEIVAALGGSAQLVGISHECDYPAEILQLPRVTATPINRSLSSLEIDEQVRNLSREGRPVIGVDAGQLRDLAPDIIISQGLCEVCALADGEAHRLARVMVNAPNVLTLKATRLAAIWDDIELVGSMLGRENEARHIIAAGKRGIEEIKSRRPEKVTRALCIEWLDPLYLAGHWVPDMIAAAGGRDVGATPGSHSVRRPWEELDQLAPDIAIVMLCGFDLARAMGELARLADDHPLTKLPCPIWVLDGNALTSRAGPRVVAGIKLMHQAFAGVEKPGQLQRFIAPCSTSPVSSGS